MRATCEGEDAAFRLGSYGADGKQPHAIRNGLICAFVVAACLWAAYPVAEMGFIDDWSYAEVAQVFAQTGHLAYNGWESATLGWLIPWGALFIKLFGFSFTVVRLSILPIAMATVLLFHAILLRFGVNERNAVLGTLTLGLSPLFLPLAASYMTDVPGLFVILLCLYLCQRAVAADSSKATIAWLSLATATNAMGGTVRQPVWLGILVMVPSAGWLLRKRRGVLLATSVLWVLGAATVFACMRWFTRQPYSVPEPILHSIVFDRRLLARFLVELLRSALCLSLVAYPILVAWLSQIRRLSRTALLAIAGSAPAWVIFGPTRRLTVPWLVDVIRYEFAQARTGFVGTPPPLCLPMWAQVAISLLVVVTVLVFVEHLRIKIVPLLNTRTVVAYSCQELWWLLGPFSLSYLALLLPRAYYFNLADRYLLPLMPIAIICLLRLHQEWIAPALPTFSVATLAFFSVLAIAGTHDCFADYRARLAAITEVRASGIPRTQIQGGYEYDGWTQLEITGHMNGADVMSKLYRLKVPAGATHPNNHRRLVADACTLLFAPYTPDVDPKFTIAFRKMWCLAPSKYEPVTYSTWLPPFKGTIEVQEIPDGSDRPSATLH